MTQTTPQDLNDDLLALINAGVILAFRDDSGAVRFAPADWATEHNLAGLALSADQVFEELSSRAAESMAEWN